MGDSMIKYIVIALVLFMVSFVGGCAGMDMHTKAVEASEIQILEQVYKTNSGMVVRYDSSILRDTRTGVNYLLNNEGGVCVMVDADGNPLVSVEE